jgi:hypothetical protein
MLFNIRTDEQIDCVDWCDIEDAETHCGLIAKCEDGYWRFTSTKSTPFSCGHMKRISKKLSELNKSL